MKALLLCGLTLLGVTVGCGSGGSSVGTPTPTATPTPLIPLETRLRTIKAGDSFSYTFTRQVYTTKESVSPDITGTGTMNTAISSARLDNQSYLLQNNVATYTVNGQPFTLNTGTYFRQHPTTGDIQTYAEVTGDKINRLTSPWATAFGTWKNNTQRNGDVTFTDGTTEYRIFLVFEPVVVTVPAGRFNTWRVENFRSSFTDEEFGSYWYAPQLGTFVKSRVTVTKDDGSEDVTTITELSAINLQ